MLTYRGGMTSYPLLVFDGDCGFCTWSAGVIRRWGQGRLVVVPWQRADLVALGLEPDACAQAVQFVDEAEHSAGAAAVGRALLVCRAPAPLAGRLLLWPPVAPLADRAYRIVAANRHRLPGATPACAA